jgi:hypothetical protein
MTVRLGKRKRPNGDAIRPASENSSNSDSENDQDQRRIQEIFRQHFEAKFKPLPTSQPDKTIEENEVELENSGEEEEWSGLSSTEENGVLEVDHTNTSTSTTERDKDEWKSFMVRHFASKFFSLNCQLTVSVIQTPNSDRRNTTVTKSRERHCTRRG